MLNAKQERFCREYIIDLNATQAAVRTGYSGRSAGTIGSRLLKKAEIRARVADLQRDVAASLGITAAGVLDRLKKVADRCMQAEPVTAYDSAAKEMVETGEYRFDSQGANRALELLGRHLGMFTDKLALSGGVRGDVEVNIRVVDGAEPGGGDGGH